MKRRIAIVGTAGLPAAYGGFETLAENLVSNLSSRYDFTVYCKKTSAENRRSHYLGARLRYIPLRSNGWQSLPYDILSLLHAMIFSDVILYLGPVAGPLLVIERFLRKPMIVNFGGLNEWDRPKLSPMERRFIRWSYAIAGKYATHVVADNLQLQKSIRENFHLDSGVIRYGGDHVRLSADPTMIERYPFAAKPYFVSVSRAQVDNNLHLVIDAFRDMPDQTLVLISNWQVSEYGRKLFDENQGIPNIHLLPAIYESGALNFLRSGARAYIHSHSYCGTAPSLVEAMCLGLPIFSWDVPTNRETTQGHAVYFDSVSSLRDTVRETKDGRLKELRNETTEIAAREFSWNHICDQYAELFEGGVAPTGFAVAGAARSRVQRWLHWGRRASRPNPQVTRTGKAL